MVYLPKKKNSPRKTSKTTSKKNISKKTSTKIKSKKPVIQKKVSKNKPRNLGVPAVIGLAVIIIAVVLGLIIRNPSEKTATATVVMDMYVMSQCPYGTQVVDAVAPIAKELGKEFQLNIEFIASDNGDGTFNSLHGQVEVLGNIVQLCAAKYEPEKYLDMITCQNENANAIPGNWVTCAKKYSLDEESIKTCYEGEEGKKLLSESIKKSEEVKATGSPTIYLNDESYRGGRTTSDFYRAICNAYGEEKPEPCNNLPEPTKVSMIVLNDNRCAECDTTGLVAQLKSLFPGLEITTLDYNDAEGQAIYKESDLQYLPAVLFDETVTKDESYSVVKNYLVPAGEYISLRIGAQFDPTAEICDNGIDDTGNGLVDCYDDTCKETLSCREEKSQQLQVFIMSDCPYGRKAIEALKPVIDNFEGQIEYEVHYIANEVGDGFQSLHGQYEVDENIIQLCVKEYSPNEWFDYLYCRSTKGVSGKDWKDCATETNVDITTVQTCFDGEEGKTLLRNDIKLAQDLGVGASPTWLVNNRYTFSGIDSETVKTNFCRYNQEVLGCENTLSSDTGEVPAGSC